MTPLDLLALAITGEAEWWQQGGRADAMAAAEALRAEGIEAKPWRLRDGWGLAAGIGAMTVAGPIGEVRAWAAGQAPAGEDSPGSSPAGDTG